jgi:hypothetical protein
MLFLQTPIQQSLDFSSALRAELSALNPYPPRLEAARLRPYIA